MKMICIARNYVAHAKELKNETPDEPVLFMKPDTAILKGWDFYLPEFSDDIHYELELIVKISKGGKYIAEEHAADHYEQIGLGIDFTARDVQSKLKEKGLPWEKSKAFDGSAVISEFFPKEDFDLENISFELKKNKQSVQQGNSNLMIFKIDPLISYISKYFTLRVGDIIFTGTPSGVGKVNENDILDAYMENKKLFSLKIY